MNRFFILLVVALSACSTRDNVTFRISTEGKDAESVYFTLDHHGNPVIAWTENDQGGIRFFYAIATDRSTFSERINVPVPSDVSTHAEGMPKVAFKKNGTIIAAYETKAPTEKNKFAGAIYFVQSDNGGQSWSTPAYIHSDTISGRSRSFFDIETLPNGEVGAAWLDIKLLKSNGGRSIRFATTEHGTGFTKEILVDSSACECCRVDLYADRENNISLAYRGLMRGPMAQPVRDMMFVSLKKGATSFTKPMRISPDNWVIDGCPHTGPGLVGNGQGIHATWYTEGGSNGIFYAYADHSTNGFSSRENISFEGHHPQISADDENVVIVWDENSRIRYQIRKDSEVSTAFLTPENTDAYLPVIVKGKEKFLVGYLMKVNGVTSVFVSRLRLPN